MDIDRQRIQDDLRGIVGGDVFCDRLMTQLYASDASIYQVEPLGVVRPRTVADVMATAQYAAEHEISLHPRGTGSGVAGESLGNGLIIDFTRYMRRITISPDGSRVVVQSGAILAEVNRALRDHQRWFGPDPVTRSVTTMGSVLATNASGSHYMRSGSARDTIESMRVVTVDGELLDLSVHHPNDPGTPGRLARGIAEIQSQFQPLLDATTTAPKSRGGYRLDDVVDASGAVNLAKFMVGTQGTLGILIDATVRTEPIATHRGVVLCFYHRLDIAARGAVAALKHGLVACDLMDRRLLQIARDTDPRFAELLPREAEAMVLVEIQSESLEDLHDRLAAIRESMSTGHDASFASLDTVKQSERDLYWQLSRRVIPRLYRFKGTESPVPFIEDVAVPSQRLPAVLTAIQDTLKRNQATGTLFAHVGHGQLHLRPFLDLRQQADHKRLHTISKQIAEVVWEHGGQVSVEHAAGLSRSYLLPAQFGDLWQAMGQVKRLFDPQHRLNPGKLFGAVLQKPNENLRPTAQTIDISSDNRIIVEADQPSAIAAAEQAGRSVPQLQVLQQWPAARMITTVAQSCNGCARCRTTSPGERQCPVFRATPREEASPRAKANLLRGVLSGQLSVDDLTGERAKEITDLCFNCHQCRLECPASVDIPKIVGELKSQYVATNGLPVSDLLMGRIDLVAAFASRAPWLSNQLIRGKFTRWIAEKLFGLSAARELPPFVRETFLRHAHRRRWTRPLPQGGLKVLYFVDQFANFHDPDIGRALGEVLQQNSIGIYVPLAQSGSGMARITAGDLKGARKIARHNVRLLADAVRSGYTVIATEPAAVLCLKHEYPNLLDDEDAHLVAEHSHEACAYLWNLHQGGRLSTEFQNIDAHIAYHQPCHLRVLDPHQVGPKLLELIPGMEIERIEAGCTGMAGTWGLQRKNYRNSLRIGWPLISAMRSAKVSMATTECSACRMQIEHGSGRSTIHPLKLLAYAYGRMPKIEKELQEI
ncbi:Anaerobic glycerol-3-phosphate dehydrogenase subunit C [Rubripirellula tenax]|uniref:Anaerobic glycerol-3-phosphate dehydrogenase subunit C n=1 Tax=Rubripirellula tenax TaxID=2528015 RepID=A0A5C6FDY5_9BACT|nr:FAD-binding oxidoreductase [Rubripirellula tenax]TWU58414.1 Anaerobic glycerol-3-phosphate dehydrogenase subunit C [Rubripirellula tenax]